VDLAPFQPGMELLEVVRQGAESLVNSIASDLERSGLKTQTNVLAAYPRMAIPEYAKNWKADFVLVGSHGSTEFARFLLGSVAQAVVRNAPCSVEIVRPGSVGAGKGLKILLATDGSEPSVAAARSIGRRPWPPGTCVKIISAVRPLVPLLDATSAFFDPGPAIQAAEIVEKENRAKAAEAIAQARVLLRGAGTLQIDAAEPLSGDPKAVILDEAAAWGANIIVLGSHGWHGMDRLVMGSVSEAVAMHARCSVEVIR